MGKYFFLRSVKQASTGFTSVEALSGQIVDSKPVDTSLKVACPREIRDKFVIGTIFYCTELKLTKNKKFYTTSEFERLTDANKDAVLEYESLTGTKFVDPMSTETMFEKITTDATLKAPTSKFDGFYMSNDDWRILVRNIKRHVNTMIIGPTGSGKTSCVKEVCQRMGIPLHVFDMGSMIDPISSLLGVHRLEDGHSVFDYAKFTQVIQEPCVILLDELSRASAGTNNVLFPCLDDRRTLSIEIAGGKDMREIKVHPDVTFIATANIGAEYTGTNSLDRALVNRFFPLELGYIPNNEEEEVLIKRTGISKDKAKMVVKIANNIRSLFSKQEVSVSLSIRETLLVSELVSDGWDLGKAMEMIYLPLYEGTKTEGERSTVHKTLLSY